MPTIQVNQGTPPDDRDDGTYWATLVKVAGPTRIYPAWAGPDGSDVLEWTFAFDDGGEIRDSSGPDATPRAKVTGWLKALGHTPQIGVPIDTDVLLGRRVLLTVGHKESGWPKIESLAAPPVERLQQQFAQATGAPTRTPTRRAVAEPVAAAATGAPLNLQPAGAPADDLPF